MLRSIDVLIGLTVVLLALSMAVTVITQSITTIINSRGRHLRRGLTDLLQQLDPGLTETISSALATRILTHPLVSGSSVPFASAPRLGNVIHREEFTKLVIGLGTENTSLTTVAKDALTADAKEALKTALKNNGVAEPEAVLKNVRTLSLELERAAPELSNTARQNAAILRAAESDLVAKINTWFDQTMDRTSQRFTASTRAITFAGAFIVAFGLQVDTPSLVNRLAADDKLREAFVQQGQTLNRQNQASTVPQDPSNGGASTAVPPTAPAPNAGAPTTGATAQETAPVPRPTPGAIPSAAASTTPKPTDASVEQDYRKFLIENGIVRLPSADGWTEGYSSLAALLGMLVTSLLLSLGAPFWYSALGQLLQLRSVLAFKDDAQRTERQSNEPPPPSPAGAAAAGRSAAAAPPVSGATSQPSAK